MSTAADDPEFYVSSTVVDVPFGVSAGLFTGATGSLKRIKWEISEKELTAAPDLRRASKVSTGRARAPPTAAQVIAAFDIDKHFDVQHEYNPQTGEELNVVGENGADRPWYQREYMRVDWSSNKIVSAYSFDPLASLSDEPARLARSADLPRRRPSGSRRHGVRRQTAGTST